MVTTVEQLSGYLAPSQAAARLGIAEATLRLWAKGGRIPALATPTGRLYRDVDVARVARERAEKGNDHG